MNYIKNFDKNAIIVTRRPTAKFLEHNFTYFGLIYIGFCNISI